MTCCEIEITKLDVNLEVLSEEHYVNINVRLLLQRNIKKIDRVNMKTKPETRSKASNQLGTA